MYIPTLQSIMKLFDSLGYRVNYSKFLSDTFACCAISISNQVDHHQAKEREKKYGRIMSEYQPNEQRLIEKLAGEIFALCSSCAHPQGKFGDWLGELYMMSGTSSSNAGQFFTPYSVSKACAEVAVDAEIVKKKMKKREVLVISEPASGSGGMILATIDVLWNKYHFNYTENCFVEASDIDSRCVHMCYIQLSLAGVPAIVKQQDALTRELFDVWYTPAYLFQYLRFREFEKCAHM